MKGHPDVVCCLIDLLRGELGARDQYFLHSRLYEDMGYAKLYERINHEMEEETQHADASAAPPPPLPLQPSPTPKDDG